MRTRTIFLDTDGTLTDFEGRMPDSAKEALERAHRAGYRLVLSSGRGADLPLDAAVPPL